MDNQAKRALNMSQEMSRDDQMATLRRLRRHKTETILAWEKAKVERDIQELERQNATLMEQLATNVMVRNKRHSTSKLIIT